MKRVFCLLVDSIMAAVHDEPVVQDVLPPQIFPLDAEAVLFCLAKTSWQLTR